MLYYEQNGLVGVLEIASGPVGCGEPSEQIVPSGSDQNKKEQKMKQKKRRRREA